MNVPDEVSRAVHEGRALALGIHQGGVPVVRETKGGECASEVAWVLEGFTLKAAWLLLDNYLEPFGYVARFVDGTWVWEREWKRKCE